MENLRSDLRMNIYPSEIAKVEIHIDIVRKFWESGADSEAEKIPAPKNLPPPELNQNSLPFKQPYQFLFPFAAVWMFSERKIQFRRTNQYC